MLWCFDVEYKLFIEEEEEEEMLMIVNCPKVKHALGQRYTKPTSKNKW